MSQARIQHEAGSKQSRQNLWFVSTKKTTILPSPNLDPDSAFLVTPSSCSLSVPLLCVGHGNSIYSHCHIIIRLFNLPITVRLKLSVLTVHGNAEISLVTVLLDFTWPPVIMSVTY
jgi:hypothetical protein